MLQASREAFKLGTVGTQGLLQNLHILSMALRDWLVGARRKLR